MPKLLELLVTYSYTSATTLFVNPAPRALNVDTYTITRPAETGQRAYLPYRVLTKLDGHKKLFAGAISNQFKKLQKSDNCNTI